MSSGRWLTYKDAAMLLGMTPGGLRNKADRLGWEKRPRPDGKVLVLVPEDLIPASSTAAPADAPPPHAVQPEPDLLSQHVARIATLEARDEELRERWLKVEDEVLRLDNYVQAPWWRRLVMRRPSRLLAFTTPLSQLRARILVVG